MVIPPELKQKIMKYTPLSHRITGPIQPQKGQTSLIFLLQKSHTGYIPIGNIPFIFIVVFNLFKTFCTDEIST